MKFFLFTLPFIIFLFSGNLSAQRLDTKFQSWNEIQVTLPLKKAKDSKGKSYDKVTAVFTGNLRQAGDIERGVLAWNPKQARTQF